jgi:hypothetical protein
VTPEEVHIEGGDVVLWDDYIFIEPIKGVTIKSITAEPMRKAFNILGFISK